MCNSVKEKSSNSTHLKINERKVQITCVYKCKFYFIFAFYDYSLRVMIWENICDDSLFASFAIKAYG